MKTIETAGQLETKSVNMDNTESKSLYNDSERPMKQELPSCGFEKKSDIPEYSDSERFHSENTLLGNSNFSDKEVDLDTPNNIEINNDIYKNCPIENGEWNGERGESNWNPDNEYIPQKSNPENKTWGDILKEYDITGILFENGEPDFSCICKGEVSIDGFSEKRSDNFDKADIELANQKGCSPEDIKKWRTENKYTWHECKDMKTMQKVPSIIHGNISHRGGVSVAKGG